MLFNSFEFLLFFPTVFVLYFSISHRYRWLLLLASSYFFYAAWEPSYIFLILGSTAVDYFAGKEMEKSRSPGFRTSWLVGSLFVNLGMLFFFKYYDFFTRNVNELLGIAGTDVQLAGFDLLLPVGISFYTFQSLAYTIDVYRGQIRAEHHFGKFALYVSFFPQLVAGPIERAYHLLPQFNKKISFSNPRINSGIKFMIWGLFQKVVIADNIAPFVNMVYGNAESFTGAGHLLGTYLFAFQIYCDFAGYSFIAIGAAKVLGFDLIENFRTPYLSKNIQEFWKRWHISLSTWFKDYLYIPLGGSRVSKNKWIFNLMVVFVISGFWHGAAWTFIVWGAIHGGLLVSMVLLQKPFQRLEAKFLELGLGRFYNGVRILLLFHLVCLAWTFFRSDSIGVAWDMVVAILQPWDYDFGGLLSHFSENGLVGKLMFRLGLLLIFLFLDPFMDRWIKGRLDLALPRFGSILVFSSLIAAVVFLGFWGEVEFIYFQF